MKTLFITVLLVCSSAAFANNGGNSYPAPSENNTTGTKENKTVKQVKNVKSEDTQDKKQSATKRTTRVCNTNNVETPGYGIGSYFVEFVHRNNIKLVKLLAD